MVAFATQSNIQTTGASVVPIGANGAGRSKLLSAAELRTFASLYSASEIDTLLAAKQATLVSGTNLKSINGTTLLGSGDLTVTATPAGSSGQLQYNNAGAFGGAAAMVYAASGTHVAITAQGTGIIPLCVKAVASQTANIFESQISTGAVRAKINSIGDFSNARASDQGESFGNGANAGDWGTAIGRSAINNVGYGVAVGRTATAGSASVSVGAGSSALDDCVAVGYTANAGHTRCYVFGRGAASSAANQVVFLDATHLLLTGTTAKFSTSTSFEAFQIDRNATAGQTRMLLWDIDKGSLQRVSIGASDSGGTGFKVLRVPN